MIGQSRIALENTASQMMWSGESLLAFNGLVQPSEVFDQIKQVTVEEIQKMAQRMFQPKGMAIAGIGPHGAGLELNRWELVS